ncbi:hypothetical protein [uncultured Eubacterium sp.]|uniref:hypothetical protein n=1 Tax=uncultured Eubacterium sp. TaxID=165185 RepID=UPI0025CE3FAE|nr:hypothetical protein [uncultured Eubacterium sp.]
MADNNNQNAQQQNPAGANTGDNNQNTQQNQNGQQANNVQPPEIDYEKLSSLVAGKQSATEDSVLKGYFKQQGLSKEEMDQAISAFKAQKAANQPDVTKMQADIQTAQAAALKSQIENKALLMHSELGIDLKTIPYVMKLADLSAVAVNGAIDDAKLKDALNKVLEDVPQLKAQQEQSTQGFHQIGASPSNNANNQNTETKPVATKSWNRWNH